jgi:glycosyltransferase involved in cell wall biosynthesis
MVLPSDHRETWGLVVNEALASGLPCIVSDACGCSEELAAPINPQFRFPLGDTTAIADALLTAMRQPCPMPVLRERVEKFDINATVKTVARLFHSGGVSIPAAPSFSENNYGEQ